MIRCFLRCISRGCHLLRELEDPRAKELERNLLHLRHPSESIQRWGKKNQILQNVWKNFKLFSCAITLSTAFLCKYLVKWEWINHVSAIYQKNLGETMSSVVSAVIWKGRGSRRAAQSRAHNKPKKKGKNQLKELLCLTHTISFPGRKHH